MGYPALGASLATPRRLRWWPDAVAAAVLVACAVSYVLVATALGWPDVLHSAAAFASLVLCAAVVARSPAHRTTAGLLVLGAIALTVGNLQAMSDNGWGGYWTMVGWIAFWWPLAALTPVFLIFPAAGFETAAARRLSIVLAVVVGARALWATLWDPAFNVGVGGDALWVTAPWASADRLYAVQRVESALVAVLMVATVMLLVGRWRRARGLQRTPTRAVAAAGVVLAITVAAMAVAGLGWERLGEEPFDRLRTAALLALAAAPLVVLAVALWVAWHRARLVEALMVAGGEVASVERVLRATLDDPAVRLHLRAAGGWVDARGRLELTGLDEPPAPAAGARRHVLVATDDVPTVLVDVTEPRAHDEVAVDAILATAALTLEHQHLALERQARTAELAASRSRVVEAQLAERRRLERDLHDGVQQHLLAVSTSLARVRLADDDTARGVALDDARAQVADAMARCAASGAACTRRC